MTFLSFNLDSRNIILLGLGPFPRPVTRCYNMEANSGAGKAARIYLLNYIGLSLLQQRSSLLGDAFSQLVDQSSTSQHSQVQLCLTH